MNIFTFGRRIRKLYRTIQPMKLMRKRLRLLKARICSINFFKPMVILLLVLIAAAIFPHGRTQPLLKKTSENTVKLRSPSGAERQGLGTGFQVKAPSGRVVTMTNAHVCDLAKNDIIMVFDKKISNRYVPKRVLERYAKNDLCIVEGLEGYGGLELADSYKVGQYNYAVGYPLGEELNISGGYLKGLSDVLIGLPEVPSSECTGPDNRIMKINLFFGSYELCSIIRKAMQTNINIHPGNSGSPMVNEDEEVTGVVFATNSITKWGSSVPLEYVVDLLSAY